MTDHRKLLMNISDHLTFEDFAKLKYICKEDIPAGIAENITRPFDFFAKLERKGFLSEGNYDYLALRLRDIGRIDLKEKLLEIKDDALKKQQEEIDAAVEHEYQTEIDDDDATQESETENEAAEEEPFPDLIDLGDALDLHPPQRVHGEETDAAVDLR